MNRSEDAEYTDIEDLNEKKSFVISLLFYIMIMSLITVTIFFLVQDNFVEGLELEVSNGYSQELTKEEVKALKQLLVNPTKGVYEVGDAVEIVINNKYTKKQAYKVYVSDNNTIVTNKDNYYVLETYKIKEALPFVQPRDN